LAAAQKMSALNAASWFAERRSQTDTKAFDKPKRRKGREAPRPKDYGWKDLLRQNRYPVPPPQP
jgi:hypothetical protein